MKAVETIVEAFPAMVIVERAPGRSGYVEITAADTVAYAIPSARYGHQWRAFSPGSVVSYARQYDECPVAAIDRERKLGGKLHWFNPNAVVLTAEKREVEKWVGLVFGQRVKFEGRIFRVEPMKHNRDHVVLIDETEMAEAEQKAAWEAEAQG